MNDYMYLTTVSHVAGIGVVVSISAVSLALLLDMCLIHMCSNLSCGRRRGLACRRRTRRRLDFEASFLAVHERDDLQDGDSGGAALPRHAPVHIPGEEPHTYSSSSANSRRLAEENCTAPFSLLSIYLAYHMFLNESSLIPISRPEKCPSTARQDSWFNFNTCRGFSFAGIEIRRCVLCSCPEGGRFLVLSPVRRSSHPFACLMF